MNRQKRPTRAAYAAGWADAILAMQDLIIAEGMEPIAATSRCMDFFDCALWPWVTGATCLQRPHLLRCQIPTIEPVPEEV